MACPVSEWQLRLAAWSSGLTGGSLMCLPDTLTQKITQRGPVARATGKGRGLAWGPRNIPGFALASWERKRAPPNAGPWGSHLGESLGTASRL